MTAHRDTPLSDDQRTRIDELCAAALALAPHERRAYIDRHSAGDEAVRQETWSIVSALADDGFLETPVELPPIIADEDRHAPARRLGRRIGPYTLNDILGEGGFAVVYRAVQDRPMKREVALKLIKPGMDSRAVVARFEAERQALAIMDHPGVARVFDGGVTDDGVPYFVMELVTGQPITRWCDNHRLTIEQRLALFIEVCDAVQHAHQKGVIHRDLKPSNILVHELDGAPRVKVIDFGIAKALHEPLIPGAAMTLAGQFIGTPEYMPPEQMGGSGGGGGDIDTRTDVYALGVALYELLGASRPIDARKLSHTGLLELQRAITEATFPRPSARAASMPADAASARRATPQALTKRLAGDLDGIAMRCLARDRDERYDSVGALAADIRRHLDNEPIEARPPSARYRLRKFVRRHRVGVAVGAAFAFLLIAGASTIIALGASALRQANRSTQFMNKFIPALAEIDEETSLASIDSVKDMLDILARGIDTEFADYPDDRAGLHTGIGLAYLNRQRDEEAIAHFRSALNVRLHERGSSTQIAEAEHNLARSLWKAQRFAEARPLYESSIRRLESARRPDEALIARGKHHLAATLRELGDTDAAERLYLEALELRRRAHGQSHPDYAETLFGLALLHRAQGKFDAAIDECRRALAIIEPLAVGDTDIRLRRVRQEIAAIESDIAALK